MIGLLYRRMESENCERKNDAAARKNGVNEAIVRHDKVANETVRRFGKFG